MAKNPKERGLGRGLGALIQENAQVPINAPKEAEEGKGKNKQLAKNSSKSAKERAFVYDDGSGENVIYVDINDIKPNRNQPRKNFDPEKIQELADSIIEHGIIQPLIVRPASIGYEIVAGERRYRAARKAGLKTVPCISRDFSDEENMLIAIIENMQRENLDPIEEAEGINQMIKTYGLTQEEVSRNLGKSRPYITNALRLLNLSSQIREMISEGSISPGHARALLAIPEGKKRDSIAERIVKEGLSVRQVEKMASQSPGRGRSTKIRKNSDVLSVEDELKGVLGTKVNISQKGKGGKIEIEFYSDEELNRLIDLIRTLK